MWGMREWRKGVVLAAVVVLAGCAKHPAMTTASAPPPTAGAGQVGAKSGAARPGGPGVVAASSAVAPKAAAARPSPNEFRPANALKTIHFDFDKYDIRTEDAQLLDANAAWMKGNPKSVFLIEGHADERGTNEYNLALGDRRAKATMNYLVAHGVAASRISTISYGEERPLCAQHNEACWAQNRRAQFLVKAE